ncbi:LLM class flavin-dependent oxidoreductase [Kribbella solani]|uniref:Alkanesulfonate monooxygenase SsuD/methylene tetrahydromethanopterin reductase-like flavin-dependent oxidoreductase (Luciferase family) n=1 Tax=Kribbella solani TaxID=236067 RepID=A0A841DXX4_9ACTN|nr:LLM class flavin-dependent oxidoreductase [Kribbella solani]MBB5982821.1 alkanesulfonate monooxygenase SsuD/methylene tetrahydromethanopterin reductase-like flavin-dependent oxidoreductase (luciferase family) [Kribbella solani]
MTVRFGYGSPDAVRDVGEIVRLARQADRDGLDHVSLADHPYVPDMVDGYAAVAFLLGRTERLSAFVNVTNLPLRPAPVLARTATSLAALSGGRFVLGLGAGGAWDRIATMGVPELRPAEAVEAFEEAMRLVQALSAGGTPVPSKHYPIGALRPAAVPAPPIWTGSNGPKSLAATGRNADGWIPGRAADWLSERYRWSRPIIDEAALAAGRKPSDIATIYNLPGTITETPLRRTRDDTGRWLGGSPSQWIEELTDAVLNHDAAGFTLFPNGPDPYATQLSRWAEEIAPAVRSVRSALFLD